MSKSIIGCQVVVVNPYDLEYNLRAEARIKESWKYVFFADIFIIWSYVFFFHESIIPIHKYFYIIIWNPSYSRLSKAATYLQGKHDKWFLGKFHPEKFI